MPQFFPVTVDSLLTRIVETIRAGSGRRVIAVDGADAADPVGFAARLVEVVREDGGEAAIVSLHDFVKPASVRLEFGHTDELSYRTTWFDYAALDREVVTSVRERGEWLPALWNETTDRSARAARRPAGDRAVIVVAGPMLLGRGLRFDVTVRLQMSESAVRRRTPGDRSWSIPPLFEHDSSVTEPPTFTVRWDHPDRPALAGAENR